jgi:3'(2'), 5'-bisphosphate nucleotidase
VARLPEQRVLLDALEDIARRAGDAVMAVYGGSARTTRKDDGSPLTAADLASQEVILTGLNALAPHLPVLSEETEAQDYAERRGWSGFFSVDPLDGTKEFLKRTGEFTVNIALIENGRPVAGVVCAPSLDRTYLGAVGSGAWRRDGNADRKSIQISPVRAVPRVVTSVSHAGPDMDRYLAAIGKHERVAMGSSLKLCLVAEGAADLYPRLGPTMEWDTAAAHAVVAAAGGKVVTLDGDDLVYNKPDLHNPWFVVIGDPALSALALSDLAVAERRS